LRYLREIGVAAGAPVPTRPATVIEFEAWMRDRAGLAEGTITATTRVIEIFLEEVGEKPTRLTAAAVRGFVLKFVSRRAPCSAGGVTGSVRRFLRFLVAQGRCSADLLGAVPRIPSWRQTRLPKYLPREHVERLIAAGASEHHRGTAWRNRAVLLLLARVGLRGHEVAGLRFGDIDWHRGRLRVLGKGRREAWLPLPQDVGDAVLRHLKTRPPASTDQIFLSVRPPIRPLTPRGVRGVVQCAIDRAGIQAPSRGSHILRHSLATGLLREGTTLDTIGAVLRHRSLDITGLYAKVDVEALRQVAQPWPGTEVSSC